MSASQAAQAIAAQKLSPVELMNALLERIGRLDPALNVFIRLDGDAAMDAARSAEAGRGNIWPKGGDISVGRYSSTAPSVMRSATMPADLIADARPAVMSASSLCRAGRSVVAPENPPSPSARRQNPALVALAGDEGFAGFAPRLRDIGQQLAEARPDPSSRRRTPRSL
jgi:hypothetical protein